MAEDRTFTLVGSFKDGITPSLKKLDRQFASLTKTFEKFSGTLRPISKELGIMAAASMRVVDSQKQARGVFDGNVRVLREYKKALGQATSAQMKLSKSAPRSLAAPRMPRAAAAAGRNRGAASAAVAGGGGGANGLGVLALAKGGIVAGLAFQAASNALSGIKSTATRFVMAGKEAEQAVIQMAGTLQTLGKVGDFTKSRRLAETMMQDLSKVAAALPGSTQDYLTILQQTLDDQIQAFGSVEAVQKNLQGIDYKTGKKMAGGMEQSFTALFGMAAQVAGLRPQIAAMDLNQLRQSPQNIRNIQLLTRNPTLAKFYLEEMKKSGGDFIMALDKAMKKAITPEQIEALKNSFDSAYQSFITTFTDPYSGIFAPMKKVKIRVEKTINGVSKTFEEMMSTMDIVGVIMRNINDIVSVLLGTGIDPLRMFNQFLFDFAVEITILRAQLQKFAQDGLDLEEFSQAIGEAIGNAIGNFANWLASLDYEKFFQSIDKLVYGFFKGLFKGILEAFQKGSKSGKGGLGQFATSVSGTVTALWLFTAALTKASLIINKGASVPGGAPGVPGAPAAPGRGGRNRGGFAGAFTTPATRRAAAYGRLMRGRARGVMGFAGEAAGLGYGLMGRPGAKALAGAGRMVGAVGRNIPGGALAMGALDAGMRIAGGEDVGRAIGGAAATAVGSTVGAILGQALIPIPGVGAALGGIAGGIIGDKVATAIQGPTLAQNRAADMQLHAAKLQETAAKLTKGGLSEDAANYAFGSAEQFSKRLQALGIKDATLSTAYKEREKAADVAAKSADALNKKITELKNQKLPADLIVKQVRPLQDQFNKASAELKRAQDAFDAQFRKTPALIQKSITDSLSVLSFKNIETILGNKVNALQIRPPGNPLTLNNQDLIDNYLKQKTDPKTSVKPIVGFDFRTPNKEKPIDWFSDAKGSPGVKFGSLGAAVNYEMKNKPPGSDLVVANSSETIIPAAKGNAGNISDFVGALMSGFSSLASVIRGENTKTQTLLTRSIQVNVQGDQQILSAIRAAAAAKGFNPFGGGLGGSSGSLSSATQLAQSMGLMVTSGFRPGDPGYHGANRARDYSNGTGPTPQMMAFAQRMVGTFGSSISELIYTPLGYSIKNGRKVPPIATGSHYNHVHVAFAKGLNNGTFFPSASEALAYERAMMPGSVKVASITGNSREALGGTYNVTNNITIEQQPGQDPEALASIVALKISNAVNELRSASYYV